MRRGARMHGAHARRASARGVTRRRIFARGAAPRRESRRELRDGAARGERGGRNFCGKSAIRAARCYLCIPPRGRAPCAPTATVAWANRARRCLLEAAASSTRARSPARAPPPPTPPDARPVRRPPAPSDALLPRSPAGAPRPPRAARPPPPGRRAPAPAMARSDDEYGTCTRAEQARIVRGAQRRVRGRARCRGLPAVRRRVVARLCWRTRGPRATGAAQSRSPRPAAPAQVDGAAGPCARAVRPRARRASTWARWARNRVLTPARPAMDSDKLAGLCCCLFRSMFFVTRLCRAVDFGPSIFSRLVADFLFKVVLIGGRLVARAVLSSRLASRVTAFQFHR